MRLEHIPLILGVIVALIGLGFIADASMAAATPVTPERRRRIRAEPSRAGEAVVGFGTLCMAAALFGRDTWRYGTVAVLAGSVLLLIGVILNRAFLKEALLFRGPARRAEGGAPPVRRGRAAPPVPQAAAGPSSPAPTPPKHPPASAGRPSSSPTTVRHPTPPLASRAYKPAEPGMPAPGAGAGQARPEAPRPSASEAESRPGAASPKPASPPPSKPSGEPTPGPKERRKTPRGKR